MVRSGERRAFVKEVFQDRETMGMGDIGVQERDINGCHDGVQREKGGKRPNDIEKMVSILDIIEEGFDNWLEMSINVS